MRQNLTFSYEPNKHRNRLMIYNWQQKDWKKFTYDKQELELVCNAPKEKDGVFKVLELQNGRIDLVYIGYSSSGDFFNEIVNGDHFTKQSRKSACIRNINLK